MRPLWEIYRELPENFHRQLRFLRHFAELSCDRCGWCHLWPLPCADPGEILAAARDHRCCPQEGPQGHRRGWVRWEVVEMRQLLESD
jgi:hypothetical protein